MASSRARGLAAAAGVAALLALTACGSGAPTTTTAPPSGAATTSDAATTPPASSAPAPTTTTATGNASATPTRPGPIQAIALVRSGGFAGQTLTITVQPDGSWKKGDGRSTKGSGKLTAAQDAKLRTMVADPRLEAEAKRAAATKGACNDTYTYMLVIGSRMIKYTECPGQVTPPAVTMQIVGLLQEATAGK